MSKYYITFSFRQFTKTVTRFFTYLLNNNNNIKQMDIISEMLIMMFAENYYMLFAWLSFTVRQLLEKFNFEILHSFNFSWTWNKEANSCPYIILTFRHIYVIAANILITTITFGHSHLLLASNITFMIKIRYKSDKSGKTWMNTTII